MALAIGAAQAWATRFATNPDGISYLDIGDAYWRGDWHHPINAYWSPLYSWILGFFFKVLRPSAYWEYPVVHLVNFLIYVAALSSLAKSAGRASSTPPWGTSCAASKRIGARSSIPMAAATRSSLRVVA